MPTASQIISFALQQKGKPYVFGASGPDTFDVYAIAEIIRNNIASYRFLVPTSGNYTRPFTPLGLINLYKGDGFKASILYKDDSITEEDGRFGQGSHYHWISTQENWKYITSLSNTESLYILKEEELI